MSETQQLQHQIDRLYRKFLMMVTPVQVNTTDDTGLIHQAQIGVSKTPEILDNVPVTHYYGFHCNIPPQTDAIAIFGQGWRANPVIVGHNHQPSRPKNYDPGEVALYSMFGSTIKLDKNNQLNATSKTAQHTTDQGYTISSTNAGVTVNAKGNVQLSPQGTTQIQNDTHVQGVVHANDFQTPGTASMNQRLTMLEARVAAQDERLAAQDARIAQLEARLA